MKEKTATFIGHRQCTGLDTENLRNEIEGLVQKGVCNFLNGGMGSFDWTCARIVHEMREKYPQIRSYLVIPYLSFRVLEPQYFDEVIYPEGFEKYHYKAAIVKRNQYLVWKLYIATTHYQTHRRQTHSVYKDISSSQRGKRRNQLITIHYSYISDFEMPNY